MAVLEAGDVEDATPSVHEPHKFVALVRTEADWTYYTVPQKHCCKGLQENVKTCFARNIMLFPNYCPRFYFWSFSTS